MAEIVLIPHTNLSDVHVIAFCDAILFYFSKAFEQVAMRGFVTLRHIGNGIEMAPAFLDSNTVQSIAEVKILSMYCFIYFIDEQIQMGSKITKETLTSLFIAIGIDLVLIVLLYK